MINEEGDNAEDLFPNDQVSKPEELPPSLRPEAWHKPRKQWIRKEQWGRLIDSLLDELKLQGIPFRYLTLPGQYLFDVRHIHDLCAKRNTLLQYLGFDTSRGADVSVAEDEVRRMQFIHAESLLLPDRVESLAIIQSVAMANAKKFKSFDVINLDLCDSVASRRTHPDDSSLAAIMHLIQLQANNRTDPWILFLTTRASRESVNQKVLSKMMHILKDNIDQHKRFKDCVTKSGIFNVTAIESECSGECKLSVTEFYRAFGVGFCKWLLQLSRNGWTVRQDTPVCYRIKPDGQDPDMLSLALRFERKPVPIVDSTEMLSLKTPKVTVPSEVDIEVEFIEQFNDYIDVDLLLYKDEDLREEIIKDNAELMSRARFNRQEIIDWGRSVCWKPAG